MQQGARGTYAAVEMFAELKTHSAMKNTGTFHEHRAFVLGDSVIKPEEDKVIVVMSTLNLLQNAIRCVQIQLSICFSHLSLCLSLLQNRQIETGMTAFVMIDSTYRVIIEGHGCMPVGTVSVDQKFHIIAYAVTDNEDRAAHYQVVKTIYDAICDAGRELAVCKRHF